ncbi:hypothetical protein GCM10010510_06960 [Streptomyces anandii JCM 4720]|nr:hypothetical protein GCM10010510_06960 [Streptomyces anandii JCM 4720]
MSIGSPGYMSPEQILGKGATGAADVFSLGAVLAYAATGAPPFPGDSSAALLYKVVHEEPELGALEGGIRDLVGACLAKDPAARPAPADIARRLAPEGTARLVAGGWLPGRLVEQVSRSAVQLLNLEAGGEVTGSQGARSSRPLESDSASGPVGFSSVSVASERPAATGEFGPPPVMPGTVPPTPPPVPAPASPPLPTAPPFGVPEPRDAPPQESVAPAGASGRPGSGPSGPGRFSVTVAAGSAPGDGGRGRRMSCSVVLAVAGALAVATTVGGVLLSQLHGDGGKDGASSGAPPGSTGTRPSASAAATGAVPEVYLGTWRGDGTVTALGQDLPGGTYEIVVRQGAPGSVVGSVTQTDALGGACVDELTLKSATGTELVATGRGRKDNPSHCVPDAHEVRLRPDGDDALRFTSVDPKAGNPKARVLKAD